MVKLNKIIRVNKGNREITFHATDNKNRVLFSIDNDGVGGRLMHVKLKIKIVVRGGLLPTDIWHHPKDQ